MSARLSKAGVIAAIAAATLLAGCATSDHDRMPSRVYLDEVEEGECIPEEAHDGYYWSPYGPSTFTDDASREYLYVDDVDKAIVEMEGDYVERAEDTLVCLTQADIDLISANAERKRLNDLVENNKACKLNDEVLTYNEEFVAQDFSGHCLTAGQVAEDDQLADELVNLVGATADNTDSWPDRASAIVTLYCQVREDGVRPVMAANRQRLHEAWVTNYEEGRVYTPGYPYELTDAVTDWCGSSPKKHGEGPIPQPPQESNS